MEEMQWLKSLTESHAPSGREHWIHPQLNEYFGQYGQTSVDNINNFYTVKKGKKNDAGSIMIMAHSDEIFLMVTEICERGFLKVKAKGIDPKVLVSQEVIVHGKEEIKGVIGIKPPHLMNDEDRKSAITIDKLMVDTGYSKESLEKIVRVGDFITVSRGLKELKNSNIISKCIDDRGGIVAMLSCAKELKDHDLDVVFVSSIQEEVGCRGAKAATHQVMPTIAIAIDTTFDSGKLGDSDRENKLGNGPVICVGPNIHPKVRRKLMEVGKMYDIPFQVEVEPGSTGTDAWAIQTTKEGVPTLLISIPIKYMHTSVEMVNMNDIVNTGKLMARFIEEIKAEELEGVVCF